LGAFERLLCLRMGLMDEQQNNEFLEKLNDGLIRVGDILYRIFNRLFLLLMKVYGWYAKIKWPEIPLSPIQWVLLFYAIFGLLFLWATPIFEASDEIWHFGAIETIRETGALPEYDLSDPEHIYENNRDTIFRQEGSQPPLYYGLMALITAPIDISDAEQYRQENPHVRAGEPDSWGNKNLVLHSVTPVALSGTPLAVYLIRLLGLVMGGVTVYAVYQCGKLLAPHRPVTGLLAAVITGFNPMFLFISASVNNDTLVIMLNSLVIWLGLLMMKEGLNWKRSVAIAILLALATLTKLSALVLVPVLALAALWLARRQKDWKGLLILGGAMLVAWLVIAGWWYFRNYSLYGDLFGTQMMAAVAGARQEAFDLGTAFAEFEGFRQSYWGVFGAFNILSTPLFYALADFMIFTAIFGVAFVVAQLLSIQDFGFARRELSLMLFLLGIVLIGIIAYFAWTSQTYASQGRLLFPFLAATSPVLAVGLIELLWWIRFLIMPPDRSFVRAGDAVPEPILRESLRWPIRLFGLLVFLIPFTTIAPQYAAPAPINEAEIPAEVERVYARYDGIELIGYDAVDRRYFPGERVRITLYWRVLEPSEDDLSLAIALVNPFGDVISRRTISTYPGAGSLRTSSWEAGVVYADTYEIELTRSLNARYPFRIDVSWYRGETDNRIEAVNQDGSEISVLLDIGAVVSPTLRVPMSGLVDVSEIDAGQREFNGSLLMNGYRYESYEEQAVFGVEVLWDVRLPLDKDYIAFLHVYDEEGVLVTQDDFQPELPTRYWEYGEDFRLRYQVRPPETGWREGTYHIHIGWYEKTEPYTRMAILLAEGEPKPTTIELPPFTVDANGQVVLPELDIADEATEEPLQGAPPPPAEEASEESILPEATVEASEAPESTAEADVQAEASEEVTAEATDE
jgi:4-amino-4-deoxy-L-arabinose transferase-like glycosyltransferase